VPLTSELGACWGFVVFQVGVEWVDGYKWGWWVGVGWLCVCVAGWFVQVAALGFHHYLCGSLTQILCSNADQPGHHQDYGGRLHG